MDGARTGSFDIIGSLFYDASLEQYLTYADPFYETDIKFVVPAGSDFAYTTLDDLKPYSVAVGDGFLYEDNFDKNSDLNKLVVTTTLQGIQMVAHGRADLTLDSVDVVNYAIHQEDPGLADKVSFAPGVLTTQNIHMAVRNNLDGKDQLISKFNQILSEMRQDGSLDEMLKKHKSSS